MRKLDTSGLYCPEPVMMLHEQINLMQVGERIEVIATDPSTMKDFLRFCTFLGHEMIVNESDDQQYRYIIEKGNDEEE